MTHVRVWFPQDEGRLLTLQRFSDSHAAKRALVADALSEFSDEMINTVEGACSTVRPSLLIALSCDVTSTCGRRAAWTALRRVAESTPCCSLGVVQVLQQLDQRLYGEKSADGYMGETFEPSAAAAAAPSLKSALQAAAREAEASATFSYAITAARRSEQRRLLNYIRLADFMICDTLRLLLIDSIGDMLGWLRCASRPWASCPTHPAPEGRPRCA